MKRFVVVPILILAFATTSLTPIAAHKTSGSDCGALFGEIASAGWELLQKTWEVAKAWARLQSADGWFAKRKAQIAYAKAGIAFKLAERKVKKAWSHWKEHCVPQFG